MCIGTWFSEEMAEPVKLFCRSILTGVRNLIYWFPVIWRDRNWDERYISQILRHKMVSAERFFMTRSTLVDAPKIAHQLHVCIALLDRHIASDYDDLALRAHRQKWGDPSFAFVPLADGNFSCKTTYPGVETEEDEVLERRDRRRWHAHEEMLRQQDIDYLFKMMAKHYSKWWD